MMANEICTLIESSVAEIQWSARNPNQSKVVHFYAQVLTSHLAGDAQALKELLESLSQSLSQANTEWRESDRNDLKVITQARLRLREGTITSGFVESIETYQANGVFSAELNFVLGLCWEFLNQDLKSQKCFLQAALQYQSLHCPRKHVRAFYNSIAAETRVTPYKNFTIEYHSVMELALKQQDLALAGVIQAMLSREFQILGLLEKALVTINDALLSLKSEYGSLHYFRALLQKAHLLIQTGEIENARQLMIESKISSFPEIRAIRHLLECSLDPSLTWSLQDENHLINSWKERVPELLHWNPRQEESMATKLAPLEKRLLKLIWSGPVEKWTLISKLYPETNDSVVAENRFKNLTARIRKKFPLVLQQTEGRYFIQNPETIEQTEMNQSL
jgi:hypothetical protein